MKEDKQENLPDRGDPRTQEFGLMSPSKQEKLLREEINRRIKGFEASKIRGMSLSQINEVRDKDVPPSMNGDRAEAIRCMNYQMGVDEETFEHSGLKSPGEKHLDQIELA